MPTTLLISAARSQSGAAIRAGGLLDGRDASGTALGKGIRRRNERHQ
jgi:hypothetical protein